MVASRDQAPGWTVAYGAEFWRRADATSGVDLQDVMDRVSHAITREGSLPTANASAYTAVFDGRGLRFAPDLSVEAQLHTSRVQIGERELFRDDGRVREWSILGNTAQARLGDIVEHHEIRRDGVELTWVLADRRAVGDLVVELEVDGLAYGSQTSGGAHFIDRSGIARMRIDNAELVDSGGARWPVATEIVDGRRLRWRVPGELLAAATFPVALDPSVGPEFGVDTPAIVAAPFDQARPKVAFNGNRYLVVWDDGAIFDGDIVGARVSTAGVIEDPLGIVISAASGAQWIPAVAANGSEFLVAWEDSRGSGTGWDAYAARVTDTGVVLDPGGIAITSGAQAHDHAVASDGTNFLVVWCDYTSADIHGARVSAGGTVADPNGFVVSSENWTQSQPAVASNGSGYAVVWSDRRGGSTAESNIYAARVTPTGTLLDTHGIPVSTTAGDAQLPSIASNGTDYLITWSDRRAPEFDVYGARLTSTGTVPATDVSGIPIATGPTRQVAPVTASNGTDYFVAWQQADESIYGASVTAGGQVAAAAILIAPTRAPNSGGPSIASDGADYLVAWTEETNGEDVHAARVTASGVVQDPDGLLVSTAPSGQGVPSLAASATGFLITWAEDRQLGTAGDIYGARVSPTGSIEDLAPISISRAPNLQTDPVVASNGTDYFVAWRDQRNGTGDVYGTRVTAAGSVEDVAGVSISTASTFLPLSIASNGAGYLVAWTDTRNNGNLDISGARVSSTGVVVDSSGIAISTAPGTQMAPAVASNGMDYLVAWGDSRNPSDGDIYGTRVTAAGTVADPAGIAISTAIGNQNGVSVASNGTDYFVAWTDERGGGGNPDIYGARVTDAGTVPTSDSAGIAIANSFAGQEQGSTLAFNGADYFVAWTDSAAAGGDIFGTSVTPAGSASAPIAISASPDAETSAHLAGRPGLPYLVSYVARSRVAARLVTSCGNRVVEVDESCDDGNSSPGDGCSSACATETGYICAGVPSTCSDVNECANANGGCGQICSNLPGTFACSCMSGYVLSVDGLGCSDVDECAVENGGCAAGVTCTNLPGSRVCGDCPQGYLGDGITCTDIDECASNSGDCAQICTNTSGSYACSCMTGYELDADGHLCNDIDECAANNGGCSTDPFVTCTNMPGSFACGDCPAGFTGNGATCVDIDECAQGDDDCAPNAQCTNIVGGFTCVCDAGFVGDGKSCDEEEPSTTPEPGGCGCQSGEPPDASFVLFALLFVRRRARSRE